MSIIEFFLGGICHQIPERCLAFQGRPLPLCARCTGTFLGVVFGMLMLRLMGQGRRNELPEWRDAIIPILLAVAWGVDGTNSFAKLVLGSDILYQPSNTLRVLTGTGFGLALASVLYPIYHYAFWRETEDAHVLRGHRGTIAGLVGMGAIISWALLGPTTTPYWLWTILAVTATVAVMATVNAILIVLVMHKEGFAQKWTDMIPYMAVGLLAALIETSALSLIRHALG